MGLFNSIAQAGAAIAALLYFAGWSYLEKFFRSFAIGFNEVDLSLQDITSYSFVVWRHIFQLLAELLLQWLWTPKFLPALFLIIIGASVVALVTNEQPALASLKSRVRSFWFGAQHPTIALGAKILVLISLFFIVDWAADDAATRRVNTLREDQPGTLHIDFKMATELSDVACGNAQAEGAVWSSGNGSPSSYSEQRLPCQIARFDRTFNLKFLWQSSSTLYAFFQPRDEEGCLSETAIVYRIPLEKISSSQIEATFTKGSSNEDINRIDARTDDARDDRRC